MKIEVKRKSSKKDINKCSGGAKKIYEKTKN